MKCTNFLLKAKVLLCAFFCVTASPLLAMEKEKPLVIIMLGAPGAGKGTQAVRLSDKLHLPQISTGDLFRENLKSNSSIGQKAKSYMDKGELVPDEIVLDMLFDRLARSDATNGYILDGFPRTLPQAEAFEKRLGSQVRLVVINLEVPDEVIISRLSGRISCAQCSTPYHREANPPKIPDTCDRCQGKLVQRDDDRAEIVRKRLEVYHKQTAPLKAYYQQKGLLVEIDGAQSKEYTVASIDKALEQFNKKAT